MKRFAQLYRELDRSTATLDKRAALIAYFRDAQPRDAAWGLHLLAGGKIAGAKHRIANTRELREWIAQESDTPDWLVDDSYDQVGDLAETLALLLDDPEAAAPDIALADWIEQRLLPVANRDIDERRAVVVDAWHTLAFDERLLFNKLLTGALRVGVSQRLVQQALAEMSGIDIARIAQRMLGTWEPTPAFLTDLLHAGELPGDRQQPYPFFLASPLEAALRSPTTRTGASIADEGEDGIDESENDPVDVAAQTIGEVQATPADAVALALGDIDDWLMEWKWDGIRVQLIRRAGETALWSRGEERLDGRFPEIEAAAAALPDGCVLDGELLAWRVEDDAPLPFTALQTRIQRRKPGPKTLADTPVRVQAYDLLELDGEDLRGLPQAERRARLQTVIDRLDDPRILLSPRVVATDWQAAAQLRDDARHRGVEGLMLKRLSAPYQSGRRRGDWWKWKIDPLTIDAVLVYAQAGHGRRSALYTDYTFAVWNDGALVPVAKAYSGLDDKEILKLDKWIRAHTLERFGPVRSVQAHHVFEIAFEAVNASKRHKSGIAVRFPRILRWRQDKPAAEADALSTLQALAR